MFEKFSISDIDSAGRGGEYTVQAGFGWTNGVVLKVAGEYGKLLVAPECPDLLAQAASMGGGSNGSSGGSSSTSGQNGALSARGVPSLAVVALGCVALAASLL